MTGNTGYFKVAQLGLSDEEKRCSRCTKVKNLDEFEKASAHLKGRRPECKACSLTPTRQGQNRAKALRWYYKNKGTLAPKKGEHDG